MKKIFIVALILFAQYGYAQLSGTYTIGATASNYTSFSAAISALTTNGVNGPVIFKVASGTYASNFTIPNISGSSSTNTITFESAALDSSLVVIQSNSSSDFITLSNAKHIKFQHLGFNLCKTKLTGNIQDISFSNNKYDFTYSQPISFNIIEIATGANVQYISFNNNYFLKGERAIAFEAANGSSISSNIVISDNIFIDQRRRGVEIDGENILISSNYLNASLGGLAPPNAMGVDDYYGIEIDNCDTNLIIESNKLFFEGSTCVAGIHIHNCDLSSNNIAYIKNNFIKHRVSYVAHAILVDSSANISVVNNSSLSIYYSNYPYADSTTIINVKFGYDNSNIILKNNIIDNRTGGKAFYSDSPVGSFTSDYNCLRSTGPYLIGAQYIGWKTSISSWTSSTTKDINSVSTDPMFSSYMDLHFTNQNFDNLGTPVIGVTSDIDGEIRNTVTPDIGADEFTFLNTDIGFESVIFDQYCNCQNQSIIVRVKNIGLQTIDFSIDTLRVALSATLPINYVFPITIVSSGTILSNATLDIVVSNNFNMLDTGWYNLSGSLLMQGDSLLTNNLISASINNHKIASFPHVESFESFYINPSYDGPQSDLQYYWQRENQAPTYVTYSGKYKYDYFAVIESNHTTQWNNSGPSADNTSGTNDGRYLCFVNTNSGSQNFQAKASIISPCINTNGETLLLKFYYHMFGADIDSLTIDIFDDGIWNYSVSKLTGQQQYSSNAVWLEHNVYLGQYSGTLKIRFNAYKSGQYCNIALDDFSLIPAPLVDIGNDTIICPGDTILLDAGFGNSYQYIWKSHPSNTIIGTSQFHSIDTSGQYSVKVINMYGVSISDTITIYGVQPHTASAGTNVNICKESGYRLSDAYSNNSFVCYWSTNGFGSFSHFDSINPIYYSNWQDTLLSPLYFTLDSYGFCQSVIHDTIFVNSFNSPTNFDLGVDTILCENQSIILNPGIGFISYLWQDGTTNSQFNVDSTTGTNDYWVRAENVIGCFSSDTIHISIDTCVSINSNLNAQKETMIIYPNPSSGVFNIEFDNVENISRLVVYNTLGQIVKTVSTKQAIKTYKLDLSGNSKGLYFIGIEVDNTMVFKKVVLE